VAGGSIRDLRRRIRSVKNTQQITRAMKLVAASKLKRAQDTMERARPYARGMSELLVNLARRVDELSHPLTERREGGKTLLVVVSADRGLCGGFNSNLLKEAVRWLEKHPGREVCLQLVGKKGNDFFKSRSWPVRSARTDAFRRVDFAHSREIAADLVKAFTEEGFDEVLVLSNRFRTIMTQDVELQRLLPAAAPRVGAEVDESLGQVEYLYEPAPEQLLDEIITRSIDVAMHQVMLESFASEMGARMVAMEAATKNASEMIDRLTLVMNRKRQAAITTEIIEIVSGAAALEG
jgi:F-type H+-transporting ATPase subunit gamma